MEKKMSLAETHPELAKQWHPTKNGNLKPEDVTYGCGKKVWWLLPYDDHATGKHFNFEWQETVNKRTNQKTGCPFLSGKAVWAGFNDLQTTHPETAKLWHPSKNQDMSPGSVRAGSNKTVWWLLRYHDKETDRHYQFEWKARICDVVRQKVKCPYLVGKKVSEYNSLAFNYPELAKQWHPTKNGKSTPENTASHSGKNVWWVYHYDVPDDYPIKHLRGRHYDFEWKATVYGRVSEGKSNCPFLSGQRLWPGFNDLATTHPELAEEWHPTKNGPLTPDKVMAGCEKSVWWLLSYDDPKTGKHFDFEWRTSPNIRTFQKTGCPFLSERALWLGFNDLATTHPEIAEEWHPTKNGSLTPDKVSAGSNKTVWWLLPYDDPKTGKHFDFEWRTSPSIRTFQKTGCPFLSGKAVWPGFNDLATTHPGLAGEWHPTKNGSLTPDKVSAGSNKTVWWLLPYDDPKTGKHFDFEWSSKIYDRAHKGTGCPYLSKSYGEEFVKAFLLNSHIMFTHQKKYSGLKGTGGRVLSYDFHITGTKILIEYQGIQHYKPVDAFGGKEQYEKQKEHDRRKREYAKKNGYRLIEISYKYDTYEKVAAYLDKHLLPLLEKSLTASA